MKDDSLSDVQNVKCPEYTKLPKRSECKCLCHTDANTLGYINAPMHIMPCCEPDDNLSDVQPLEIAQYEMDKAVDNYNVGTKYINSKKSRQDNTYATEIWNSAIEAAAEYLERDNWMTVPNQIRELKK